jgi:hypothetical protein
MVTDIEVEDNLEVGEELLSLSTASLGSGIGRSDILKLLWFCCVHAPCFDDFCSITSHEELLVCLF